MRERGEGERVSRGRGMALVVMADPVCDACGAAATSGGWRVLTVAGDAWREEIICDECRAAQVKTSRKRHAQNTLQHEEVTR